MSLTEQQERFYVYVYRVDGQMAYVGKGQGRRAESHLTHTHNPILRQRMNAANRVTVKVIKRNMTEADAFRLERKCINKWRKTLSNQTQGTRTQVEAIWHDCLNELQNNTISYGTAMTRPIRILFDLNTGQMAECDTLELRVRNLVWYKRQLRQLMRKLEAADPGLVV